MSVSLARAVWYGDDSRFSVPGSQSPILSPRFSVPGSWFPVPGSWFSVPGSQSPVLSSQFLVPGSWFLVLSPRFSVLSSWFLVPGSWFSVLSSWFSIPPYAPKPETVVSNHHLHIIAVQRRTQVAFPIRCRDKHNQFTGVLRASRNFQRRIRRRA